MTAQVLRFASELPRNGARLASRRQGIAVVSLTKPLPAASSPSARFWSAPGLVWRCSIATSRIVSRHGTVRPNNSFKPMPLRGTA